MPCYSSPIITTTASVTREADVLYYKADDGNIGGVGSDRAGTIQLKLHKASYTPAANQSLYTLNDGGSTADQIKIYTDSNGYVQAQFDATGGTQRTVAGPSTSVFNNLPHQVSLTYRVGYAVLYLDGVAGTVNTALVQADIPINLDRLYYNTGLIAHHQFLPDTPQDRYAYSISNGNASTDAITAQVPGYRESFRQGPNARDVLRYSVNSTTTGYRDTPGAKNVADDDKHQSRVWWRSGAFRQATDTGDNDSGDASTTAPTGLTQLSLTGDPRSSLPSNTLINDVRIWDHALSNTAGSGQRAATNSFTLASTAKVNEGITHMEDSGGGSRFKAVFAEGRHAVDDAYVLLNGNTPYI